MHAVNILEGLMPTYITTKARNQEPAEGAHIAQNSDDLGKGPKGKESNMGRLIPV